MRDWLGSTTSFTPNQDSFITALAYPNGVTATMTPDHADRLMAIADTAGATTLAGFSHGRDANNQVTSVTSTGVPADTNGYGYTPLNQLGPVNSSPGYSYDSADNLVQLPNGTTQSFDAATQLTSARRPSR